MVEGKGAIPRPSKRYPVSKKERRELAEALEEVGVDAPNAVVEHVEYRDFTVYLVDGIPCLVESEGARFPHLLCLLKRRGQACLPRVVVDRGASAAVGRGADLMVPGIRRVEGEFQPGDIVVVVDEEAGVPVAVGRALMGSREIAEKLAGERRGKAVEILHRPGDLLWRVGDSLKG